MFFFITLYLTLLLIDCIMKLGFDFEYQFTFDYAERLIFEEYKDWIITKIINIIIILICLIISPAILVLVIVLSCYLILSAKIDKLNGKMLTYLL